MMRTIKGFAMILLIVCTLCMSLTGCKKSLSVEDTVSVTFSGINGYGTAHISGEYDWTDLIVGESASDLEKLSTRMQLEDGVEYSLSKTEGLSNGDTVELKIEADNDKLKEYGYKVKEKTVKYTVEGLKDPVDYDPFEKLTVNVTDTAPYGNLKLDSSNDLISGLSFKADKTEGLKNGDVVTITVNANSNQDVQTYCAKQGYSLTRTSMEYTVSGINSYVQTLEEIPEEWLEKMKTQSEDIIETRFVDSCPKSDQYSTVSKVKQLVKKEYAGCYLLTLKEGFDVAKSTPANRICLVYKLTATSTDGEFSYYYATVFDNATLIQGTEFSVDLANYFYTDNEFVKGYYEDYNPWYNKTFTYDQKYYGFLDLDAFKQTFILSLVEKYNYVTTMEETA